MKRIIDADVRIEAQYDDAESKKKGGEIYNQMLATLTIAERRELEEAEEAEEQQ